MIGIGVIASGAAANSSREVPAYGQPQVVVATPEERAAHSRALREELAAQEEALTRAAAALAALPDATDCAEADLLCRLGAQRKVDALHERVTAIRAQLALVEGRD
jgi:hypothetical protein